MGPRVGIFLSPLWKPIMDFIYLTFRYQHMGKIKKNEQPHVSAARRLHVDQWRQCNIKNMSSCRISAYSGFSGCLFHDFPIKNEVFCGEQEKESIIRVRMGWKNPTLAITVCHHTASLVMPIGDPRDGFFYPTLTTPYNRLLWWQVTNNDDRYGVLCPMKGRL